MRRNKVDLKNGKCKSCKKKRDLLHGLCFECHRIMMKQAQRKGRDKNPFIG